MYLYFALFADVTLLVRGLVSFYQSDNFVKLQHRYCMLCRRAVISLQSGRFGKVLLQF